METENLRIRNWFYPINRKGIIHFPFQVPYKIVGISDCVQAILVSDNFAELREFSEFSFKDISPIEISEKYLLDFGFKKVEVIHEEYHSIDYELETKGIFFSYSDDWSLAIADNRKSFTDTHRYLTPNKELTNKVHLWQNIFKSLTGKDKYENQSIKNY